MGTSQGHPTHHDTAGKTHGDTVVYKDWELLQAGQTEPESITCVRVWHDDFIYGLEVFYDGKSAGERRPNVGHGCSVNDVIL
jgi:hypothetical protein